MYVESVYTQIPNVCHLNHRLHQQQPSSLTGQGGELFSRKHSLLNNNVTDPSLEETLQEHQGAYGTSATALSLASSGESVVGWGGGELCLGRGFGKGQSWTPTCMQTQEVSWLPQHKSRQFQA